jgi:hypothetical protein
VAWTEPRYKRKEVDRAAELLASGKKYQPEEVDQALIVIGNWRAAHAFPLNTFQMGLRQAAQKVQAGALIAQRLKRLPTMLDKLRRMPKTTLTRFQDIGGCRAVVINLGQVLELRDRYRRSRMKHKLVRERDYIAAPRASGYRCIHLVYRYSGRAGSAYDGLQIEIQLRTRLQHAWATAVETVGTMLKQSLKSSEGSTDWLRFFALVGSAFAFVERTRAVPETPSSPASLASEIKRLQAKLKVRGALDTYRHALKATEQQGKGESALYLLSLDPAAKQLTVTAFGTGEIAAATDAYAEAERQLASHPGAQVVLVGSRSLAALRKAYPNYFLDTELFLSQLDRALRRLEAATAWPRIAHPVPGKGSLVQGELW